MSAQTGKSQKTSVELWELYSNTEQKSEQFMSQKGLRLILPPTIEIDQNEYVVIDALVEGDPEVFKKELLALGALHPQSFGPLVSALLPLSAIPKLNASRNLRQAQASLAKSNSGLTKSNGDISMHSQEVRSTFDVNGLGYKIGILSDSYNTLFGANSGENSGDLPGPQNPNGFLLPVEILQELDFVRSDEGRAMAEIIHDIAPAAQLSFRTGFMGQASFAQGILDLANAGCDIIVDDIIYFSEPFFQDGIVAQAIDQASARGIPCFTAVGNYGSSSYESVFRGAGVFDVADLGTYKLHDFDPGFDTSIFQKISLAPGADLELFLQWDEPFASACTGCPGSQNDLDFFLFSEKSLEADKLLFSRIGGNKGSNPVEGILLNNTSSEVNEFYLVIAKVENKDNPDPDPGFIKYVDFGNISTNHIEFGNNRGTSIGHTNSAEVLSVGASLWYNTPEFNGQTPIPVINSYSSSGEVPIFFDALGNRLSQPEIRISPEVIGPDGVNTTFFSFDSPFDQDNFPNFSGTSAAAPHLAAAAALLMELADRRLSSQELRELFRDSSVDMNDPSTPGFDTGYDFKTGYG
ncbi:MAG: S8 family serine peptidase, partial [Bacteroidota bacterium]